MTESRVKMNEFLVIFNDLHFLQLNIKNNSPKNQQFIDHVDLVFFPHHIAYLLLYRQYYCPLSNKVNA